MAAQYTIETLAELINRLKPHTALTSANTLVDALSIGPTDLVQITGPPDSGKTHLLMAIAADVLLPQTISTTIISTVDAGSSDNSSKVGASSSGGSTSTDHSRRSSRREPGNVLWIDMDGRFSILRLAQILEGRSKSRSPNSVDSQVLEETIIDALKRFKYVRCRSSDEFIDILDNVHSLNDEYQLLVIDPVSAFAWIDRIGRSLFQLHQTYVARIAKAKCLQGCPVVLSCTLKWYTNDFGSPMSKSWRDSTKKELKIYLNRDEKVAVYGAQKWSIVLRDDVVLANEVQ